MAAKQAPATAPPSALQMPRREIWVDLPPEYPGFQLKLWVNPPARLAEDIESTDAARVRAGLQRIVLEHNGWTDADGELPVPTSPAFWSRSPSEVFGIVYWLWIEQRSVLPNSIRARLGL